MEIKCSSCGAQTNAKSGSCEFCGSKLPDLKVSSSLSQVFIDKAKRLGIEEELASIYQEPLASDLVGELFEMAEKFADTLNGKVLDLLADLALKHDENDQRGIFIAAQAKFLLAANLTNSSSTATLRQKYALDSRKFLTKVDSTDLQAKKAVLEDNLTQIENFKSGQFAALETSVSVEQTADGVKLAITEDVAGKAAGTIGATIGVLIAILFGIAMLAPFFI